MMATLFTTAWLLLPTQALSETKLDLTHAVVVTPPELNLQEQTAIRVLVEEVDKRSQIRWRVVQAKPAASVPTIVLERSGAAAKLPAEAYQLTVNSGRDGPTVAIRGADARGLLYGVGRLLRELHLQRGSIALSKDFKETSAPHARIRGHQLGYRPKTNSYDGWTVAMWDQYLRDLVVFGCNAIELIPPRSDDASDSPHFPLPPLRMLSEVSRLADSYGMDVWIWYPALDKDYADAKTVEFALKEWGEVFKAMPRLDAVFVPGGDPGHTQPRVLFNLLEKQTANLHRYHPKAQMWMSPQSFSKVWMDEYFGLMNQEPTWLSGIVYGPQVRTSLPALRAATPKRYPIRDYPDITHSRHCQFPVPDWDVAFALTASREPINPRPVDMANIYRLSHPHTAGFITYSEGCNDDVNKFVWSALGWNERADLREVLRHYSRYFIGSECEERFADGLFGLEKNWQGPALLNPGIEVTKQLFQDLEKKALPSVKLNWRFQQALYRAYSDAAVQARLKHETMLVDAAWRQLREVGMIPTENVLQLAEALLDPGRQPPVAAQLRARVHELAEALFQSIRMQLSVRKYQAIATERGATLDTFELPLTDAGWLLKQLQAIRKLDDDKARLARIDGLIKRTDPGPGGFYDDLGDPERQPHLVRGEGHMKDPSYLASSFVTLGIRGLGPGDRVPRAWWHHAETLYETPLQMRYAGLDKSARYRVRVVYGGERKTRIRLQAGANLPVHDYLHRPYEPLEFDVAQGATSGGELTLSWNQEPGAGGAGRGCQVAEVWLLKK